MLDGALNTLHDGLSDVKLAKDIFTPSRKTSEDSSSPPGPSEVAQGKKTQVYAPQDDTGEGSGAGTGGAGCGEHGVHTSLVAALVAAIRDIESQMGAPALVDGVPLIGLLMREGAPQDLYARPEMHVATSEDLYGDDEHVAAPNAAVPNEDDPGAPLPLITLQALADERTCDYKFDELMAEEFEREVDRIRLPAFMYGRLLAKQELAAEAERKKIKLRITREAIHDQVWNEEVERGRQYELNKGSASNTLPSDVEPQVQLQGHSEHANEGKDKLSPALKTFFSKYGGKMLKMGGKLGKYAAEVALDQAIQGAIN
ncbi:hypothetical protein CALVIDRAFT_530564 [Calocera viscosa TUFC12733]|uniref:Uncharacterized protein n=1 Tax=Calocera viscosa (strain TUFC12733) TaxID=1330018 RepID=A0A167HQX2_CALVF|nr:hypothetical protein CALVIDRAFT_530564 [Calocera viscosa TUFC12733]